MPVDVENSGTSPLTGQVADEKMEKLRAIIFDAFVLNEDPVVFVSRFNSFMQQSKVCIEPQTLAEIVVEIGTARQRSHSQLIPYLRLLNECDIIDYISLINLMCGFTDLERPQCVQTFLTEVGSLLKIINYNVKSKEETEKVAERDRMCGAFVDVLRWCCLLLHNIFDGQHEKALCLVDPLVSQIRFFTEDCFAKLAIFCRSITAPGIFSGLLEQFRLSLDLMSEMSKIVPIDREIVRTMESATELMEGMTAVPSFPVQHVETYRFGTVQSRPAILTLLSAFSVHKVLYTAEEIANSVITIGQVVGMSIHSILVDLLRGPLLILLELVGSNGERLALAEIFAYRRVAKIVATLRSTNVISAEQLQKALEVLANNSVLLNAVDRQQLDNTLVNVLSALRKSGAIDDNLVHKLAAIREQQIQKDPILVQLLFAGAASAPAVAERSHFLQYQLADKFAQKLMSNLDSLEPLIVEIVETADLRTVNLVCGILCADNNLRIFTEKLANLVEDIEQQPAEENSTRRTQIFDTTFLLLTQMHYLFPEVRLEEITGGRVETVFYKWIESFDDHLFNRTPLSVDPNISQQNFLPYFTQMKVGHAFWNDSWQFSKLLAHVPAIGEAILEETHPDSANSETSIQSFCGIFTSIGSMPSLFLCVCQWLETRAAPADSVQILANNLRAAANKFIDHLHSTVATDPSQREVARRWEFVRQLVMPSLNRMARGPKPREAIYTWLISCARRNLPRLERGEKTEMPNVKDVFFYANHQGWANPDVLLHLYRMDRNKRDLNENPIYCWFFQMVSKCQNADELEPAAELLLSAAALDIFDLVTIVQMCNDDKLHKTISFNQSWVIARLLVRALMIMQFNDQQRRVQRRVFVEWRHRMLEQSRKRKSSELDTDAVPMPADPNEKDESLNRTANRALTVLYKEVRSSLGRPKITFICFFVSELLMAAPEPLRQKVIDLTKLEAQNKWDMDMMLDLLVRFQPTYFDIPTIVRYYGLSTAESREKCLHFACSLRKTNKY